MKKTIIQMSCLITLILASAQAAEKQVPVVGIAEDGSPVEAFVPEVLYTDQLKNALVAVRESTTEVLRTKSENSYGWMLRTVVVGLGTNMELKVGPLIKFGALPRFRVGFSNSLEPSMP